MIRTQTRRPSEGEVLFTGPHFHASLVLPSRRFGIPSRMSHPLYAAVHALPLGLDIGHHYMYQNFHGEHGHRIGHLFCGGGHHCDFGPVECSITKNSRRRQRRVELPTTETRGFSSGSLPIQGFRRRLYRQAVLRWSRLFLRAGIQTHQEVMSSATGAALSGLPTQPIEVPRMPIPHERGHYPPSRRSGTGAAIPDQLNRNAGKGRLGIRRGRGKQQLQRWPSTDSRGERVRILRHPGSWRPPGVGPPTRRTREGPLRSVSVWADHSRDL